jgi:branched-chain amino acid transport system substrate-binding protein
MLTRLLCVFLLAATACAPATTPSAPPAAATAPAAKPTTAPAAKPATGEPIKIGLNFAMTIAGATPIAPGVKEGADLMAEMLNANGGVMGRPIQLITYDNENSQEKAVQFARKLIDEDKVIAIAAERTAQNQVISPIAEQAQVIHLSLVPTNSIIRGKKFGFQINARDEIEAQVLFRYIKDTLKMNSIVFIHDENPYGVEGSAEAEKAAQTVGIEIRGKVPYNNNSPDLTAEVTRARGSGGQAIVIWGIPPGPARVAIAARNIGWNAPITGSTAVASPAVVQLAGPAAEGLVSVSTLNPSAPSPADQQLIDAYKRKFGQDKTPTTFQAFGWDAVLLIGKAVEAAGSSEPTRVRDALEQLKGVEGAAGKYAMTPDDHNGVDPASELLIQVKDGRFVGIR